MVYIFGYTLTILFSFYHFNLNYLKFLKNLFFSCIFNMCSSFQHQTFPLAVLPVSKTLCPHLHMAASFSNQSSPLQRAIPRQHEALMPPGLLTPFYLLYSIQFPCLFIYQQEQEVNVLSSSS